MLDALKFAFEILIVGAFALPWLALIEKIFPAKNPAFGLHALLLNVPTQVRNAVSIALIVALGYLLGSATSRFSKDFFNDELWSIWTIAPLPTESSIREAVYYDEFCSKGAVLTYIEWPVIDQHPEAPAGFCVNDPLPAKPPQNPARSDLETQPDAKPKAAQSPEQDQQYKEAVQKARQQNREERTPFINSRYTTGDRPTVTVEEYDHSVEEVFDLQESTLLLEGLDKIDRLKQYFDQITVLRGAAFNFFIVFALSAFGILGALRARWRNRRLLNLLPFLIPIGVIAFALDHCLHHFIHPSHIVYGDPPLAELVWITLGALGFAIIWKAETALPHLRICLVSGVVMMLSFGGWWWTEVMYDTQIIHSLPTLKRERAQSESNEGPLKSTNSQSKAAGPAKDAKTPTTAGAPSVAIQPIEEE